jgi:hypothetical protein
MGMIYEYDDVARAAIVGPPAKLPVSLAKRPTLDKPSDRTQAFDSKPVARVLRRNNDLTLLKLYFAATTSKLNK